MLLGWEGLVGRAGRSSRVSCRAATVGRSDGHRVLEVDRPGRTLQKKIGVRHGSSDEGRCSKGWNDATCACRSSWRRARSSLRSSGGSVSARCTRNGVSDPMAVSRGSAASPRVPPSRPLRTLCHARPSASFAVVRRSTWCDVAVGAEVALGQSVAPVAGAVGDSAALRSRPSLPSGSVNQLVQLQAA